MDTVLLSKINKLNKHRNKYETYYEIMHHLIQITGCKSGYFAELVYIKSVPKTFCKILISDITETYPMICEKYRDGLIFPVENKIFGIPYYTRKPYYTNDISSIVDISKCPLNVSSYITIPLIIDNSVIGLIGLADISGAEFNEQFIEKYQYFFDYISYILATNQSMDEKKLLQLITSAQRLHISKASKEDIFENLLKGIIELTDSEYGFIGEVLYDNDKMPYLKSMAITNIAWNEELREKFSHRSGILFKGLDTLFGIVLTTQEIVISNDPENDNRRGGKAKIPHGHPPLNKFCGMPFFFENKFVGMVGIANSPFDYHTDLVTKLEPFLTTCASLINNIHEEMGREEIRKINTNFISQISHELKTPLNSILGFAQLLKMESNSEFIDHIINGGDKLMMLINDSLNLNRLDKYNINYTYIPVYKCVQDEINESITSLKKLNITVYNNLDKNLTVYCDAFLFDRIIKNLLSNAIKYNIASGELIISNVLDGGKMYISIKNSGSLKIDSQNLFMPFCTSDRDGGGTGLGLSITRKIFDVLGESIKTNVTDTHVEFIFSIKYKISNTKKILYIEDNKMNQILMKNILKNYEFTIKDHADDILNYINEYDILLLDLYLENNVSGFDIINVLRENDIIIPIIVITADTNPDTCKKLHEMGIKYFNKPIPIVNFLEYINETFFI